MAFKIAIGNLLFWPFSYYFGNRDHTHYFGYCMRTCTVPSLTHKPV